MREARHHHSAEASGEAAVAISGNNSGSIITNPTVILPAREEPESRRPSLLPPLSPDFTGRERELGILEKGIEVDASQRVAVITGKPGVGKTTLAVHTAFRQRADYTEGDLYADLRGVDKNPASPKEVMGRFLRALGVPEEDIPGDRHARQDTYRRVLADRPLIIVLDNAFDESQVRPLIPPGDSAQVLVTSRSQLSGLESVRRIDLEVFQAPTSLSFLRKMVGRESVDKDQKSAREVVQACGHLPLALRIAANRISSQRGMSLAHLASELRDQHELLGVLEAGDLAVRAAFNLSFRMLGKGARNAFKRLSSVPALDFGAGLCAALMDTDERHATKLLRKLAEANLVEPSSKYGRYRFHDLLKFYARDLNRLDSPQKTTAATRRMLDWLRNSTLRTQFTLVGQGAKIHIDSRLVANVSSVDLAAAWIEDELPNAVAALEVSELHSPDTSAAFALSLTVLCDAVGNWSLWDDALRFGLDISARLNNEPETAILLKMQKVNLERHRRSFQNALELAEEVYRETKEVKKDRLIGQAAKLLGALRMDLGRYEDALPLIEESLFIFKRLDIKDEIGQALYNLGTIHRASGNISVAIENYTEDLTICVDIGDKAGAAETANSLALAYSEIGELDEAERLQRSALVTFERLRNPHKISMACNDLGVTLRKQGKYEEGLEFHLRDLELSMAVGNLSGEALAQSNVAEALHALGRFGEAEQRFAKAVEILEKLGDGQRLARTLICQIPLLFDTEKSYRVEEVTARGSDILRRYGQLTDLVEMYHVLANEFFEIEDYPGSLASAEQALDMSENFDNPYLHAVSLLFAMRSSAKLNRTADVRRYSSDIEALCSEHSGLAQRLKNATQRRYKQLEID